MRQSTATHKESIKSNLGQYCFEKDSAAFQAPNDAAAEHCTTLMKVLNCDPVVLELGCGDGASLRKFQELGIQTIGVDVNYEKLKHATGDTQEADMIDFLKPQKDNSLSNIFMHHSLEHIIDVSTLLSEVSRTLKKGGLFYCVVPAGDHPHEVHHTAFDSAYELQPMGFKPLFCGEQKRFGHSEYIFIGVKQ